MNPRVAIVVLNYNGLDDTRDCLKSIGQAHYEPLTTLVVDNASKIDPTEPLAQEFPWCRVIRNPINGGWAGGNNVGIRAALDDGADLIILLNNDTVVSPNMVDRLVAAAQAHPDFGVLGPVINEMKAPDVVQTDGVLFNDAREPGFFRRHVVPLQPTQPVPIVSEVDIVNGCCMMIRRKVFEKIGFVDERYFLIHEESDFCLRALRAGLVCGVIGESLVWHRQSESFKRAGLRIQRYYDTRNLHLLLRSHVHSHRRGRSSYRAWLEYYKYAYYRYCSEREQGERESARAVLDGLSDAWLRNFGSLRARRRPLAVCFGIGLESLRICKKYLGSDTRR